jgi:CHAT domain
MFKRAQEIIAQGVDEARLAQVLGRDTVFLRAFFDESGKLLWTALSSDGSSLAVVAYGSSAQEGDRARVRWATALHDLHIELAQLCLLPRPIQRNIRMRLKKALEELMNCLNQLAGAQDQEQEARAIEYYTHTFNELYKQFNDQQQPKLLDMLATCTGPLSFQLNRAWSRQEWAGQVGIRLRQLYACVSEPVQEVEAVQSGLNTATQEYIADVSRIWQLDKLEQGITQRTELIAQVDDTLYAVPLAHLLISGKPIYQQVHSVHSSLSALFTILQQEAEREFQKQETEQPGMLVISWFKQEDAFLRAQVKWLHYGHRELAEQYGLMYYGAADDPEGSPGAISAALQQPPSYRIVTLCGHGDRRSMGVKLKNSAQQGEQEQLWDGGGLDLSCVEWLLMVSCSIGRLAASGDRDVEGFCVKLALHRALSVVACRWQVHALEACAFANEIVSQYLRLRQESTKPDQMLRAIALNEARKHFLDTSNGHMPIGVALNTISAFELYGLG